MRTWSSSNYPKSLNSRSWLACILAFALEWGICIMIRLYPFFFMNKKINFYVKLCTCVGYLPFQYLNYDFMSDGDLIAGIFISLSGGNKSLKLFLLYFSSLLERSRMSRLWHLDNRGLEMLFLHPTSTKLCRRLFVSLMGMIWCLIYLLISIIFRRRHTITFLER